MTTESPQILQLEWNGQQATVHWIFQLDTSILFDLDLQIQLFDSGGEERLSQHIGQAGWDITWLPRGKYSVSVKPDLAGIPAGFFTLRASVSNDIHSQSAHHVQQELSIELAPPDSATLAPAAWKLSSHDGLDLAQLSWHKRYEDWFFLHFDHAARVIINQFLDNSPKLNGRILDVGCGDGITDLGIFLRCQPEVMIGVDPYKGFERLPQIAAQNHLPRSVLDDPRLRFEAHDANQLPYPDSDFDVVLSWGSLEHIAGGYEQTLSEIRRVLKPGGLFFVHPGLYYSIDGNHLSEFFDDPFIHLKIPPEELKHQVLTGQPNRRDRSGHHANPAEYWQWYTELNKITTQKIERELRGMGFEPWRVGLRTANVVEYTPELQSHSMTDLAIKEMYASFVLNK